MRTLFLLVLFACSHAAAFTQTSCYNDLLAAGNKHLNAGRYDKAIQQYEAAMVCGDKPATGNGVLKNKIALARQQKKDAELEAQEAAEKERLAKEEEARKLEEQNQLAEFAWQKLLLKPSTLRYHFFIEKYPNSKRADEAKQKITEIQAQFDTTKCNFCFSTVFVKGGSFIAGDMEEHLKKGKLPPATVIDDFYIGKYEITLKQFCKFLTEEWEDKFEGQKEYFYSNSTTDRYHVVTLNLFPYDRNGKISTSDFNFINYEYGVFSPDPGHEYFPVYIYQAGYDDYSWIFKMYAKWLSLKTGYEFRFPTDVEWEYAARGGSQSKGYIYAGSNIASEVGWVGEYSSHSVGQKKPNELGIFDMTGSVSEYVDIYKQKEDWAGKKIEEVSVSCRGPEDGKILEPYGSYYRGMRLVRCANPEKCGGKGLVKPK